MKIMQKIVAMATTMILVMVLAIPAFAVTNSTKMTDMHVMKSADVKTVDTITDSYGKEYNSNIYGFDARKYGYIKYELNGKYASFSGTLVAANSTASGAKMSFAIFADGKEVYSISNFTKQMDAQSINVNLSGANVVEFMSWGTDVWDSWLYVTNGSFAAAEKAPDFYLDWTTLSEIVVIDSGNCGSNVRMGVDAYGELYFDYYSFDARRGAYAMYNLNKEYSTFSGYIFPQRNAANNASIDVKILADETVVYTKSGIKNTTEAIPFEIDVSNVKTLKIMTSVADTGTWDQTVYIGSSMLSKHLHTTDKWTVDTAATCTEAGQQTQYCTVCGEGAKTEVIPATGHTASGKWDVTTVATCTTAGEQTQVCTVCGETAEKESIPATGHTASGKWEVASEPTCTAEGEEVQYCTVCSEIADSRSIAKLEHTPSEDWEISREATCSKEGVQVKKCTACSGVVAEEPIPTVEHEYGKWTKLSGSAWNPPVVKERTCSVCNDVEHVEDNNTSWLKPLVSVIFIIAIGGVAVICVTLRMNGLPLKLASVKQLFSKETLSDTDIDDILNKPGAPTGKSSDQTEQ